MVRSNRAARTVGACVRGLIWATRDNWLTLTEECTALRKGFCFWRPKWRCLSVMHSSTFGGNQTPRGHRRGGGMMIWAPCSGRVNPNLLCNTVGSILEAICPTAKALLNLDHEAGQWSQSQQWLCRAAIVQSKSRSQHDWNAVMGPCVNDTRKTQCNLLLTKAVLQAVTHRLCSKCSVWTFPPKNRRTTQKLKGLQWTAPRKHCRNFCGK